MINDKQAEMLTTNCVTSSLLMDQVEKTKTKTKSKSYVMDLRVQSPENIGYSGFTGFDSAPAIVRLAKVKGLDVIAITDLFSAQFVDRMVEAARGSALTVIPGVGLRCTVGACRDVILSCLFPESARAETINQFLRDLKVPPDINERQGYTLSQPLDQVLHALESYQGIAIPSRLDKTPNRMAVIPELVENYGFRAFDLAYADTANYFKKRWPKQKFHLYSFSDANALAQIGSRIAKVKLAAPGFIGIREVVAREGGLVGQNG
jgi:hypothetical protein